MSTYIIAPFVIAGLFAGIIYLLWPKPRPLIPYDKDSVRHFLGDIPKVKAHSRETSESTESLFLINSRVKSPLVQLLLPGPRPSKVFLLDDPREVEDILLRRNREFDRSSLTTTFFDALLPHSTISQFTTPELKAQKRLWSDVMNTDFLRRVVAPNIQKATLELVELWRLKAGGEPFDVHHDLMNTALDAIWVAVLGKNPRQTRQEIQRLSGTKDEELMAESDAAASTVEVLRGAMDLLNLIAERCMKSLSATAVKWWFKHSPSTRRFKKAADEELSKIMAASIERFNAALEKGDEQGAEQLDTCAMDLVLRRGLLAEKKTGVPATDPTKDPAMLEELLLLLLGGHDSTANTLCWFSKIIAAYPDVQNTLRQDLLTAFPKPHVPSAAEIIDADIPYLDATIEETIRVAGTAGGTTRRVLVDTEILGYPIPAGSNILLNLRLDALPNPIAEDRRSSTSRTAYEKRTHKGLDEEAGRNLNVFEPRRWLHDVEGKDVFDPYTLPQLGFGGGLRGCFGRKLAMQELRIMMVLLILNFEFLPLPDHLQGMEGIEFVFRRPKLAYAKIRAL